MHLRLFNIRYTEQNPERRARIGDATTTRAPYYLIARTIVSRRILSFGTSSCLLRCDQAPLSTRGDVQSRQSPHVENEICFVH